MRECINPTPTITIFHKQFLRVGRSLRGVVHNHPEHPGKDMHVTTSGVALIVEVDSSITIITKSGSLYNVELFKADCDLERNWSKYRAWLKTVEIQNEG